MAIKFKEEWHRYSWQPIWYRASGTMLDWQNAHRHPLIQNRQKILDWCRENKLTVNVNQEGTNWRFNRSKELTLFLLRWGNEQSAA